MKRHISMSLSASNNEDLRLTINEFLKYNEIENLLILAILKELSPILELPRSATLPPNNLEHLRGKNVSLIDRTLKFGVDANPDLG